MTQATKKRKQSIANDKAQHLLDYLQVTENTYSYNKLKEIINLYNR